MEIFRRRNRDEQGSVEVSRKKQAILEEIIRLEAELKKCQMFIDIHMSGGATAELVFKSKKVAKQEYAEARKLQEQKKQYEKDLAAQMRILSRTR
jgi:hypothetical protein